MLFTLMNALIMNILMNIHCQYHFVNLPVSFIIFIEGELIYSVVLISAIQQKDLHTYMHSFLICFSLMVYSRISARVPCALQQDIHSVYNSQYLLIPNTQCLPPPPPQQSQVCSLCSDVSLFLFCRQVLLCHILDST